MVPSKPRRLLVKIIIILIGSFTISLATPPHEAGAGEEWAGIGYGTTITCCPDEGCEEETVLGGGTGTVEDGLGTGVASTDMGDLEISGPFPMKSGAGFTGSKHISYEDEYGSGEGDIYWEGVRTSYSTAKGTWRTDGHGCDDSGNCCYSAGHGTFVAYQISPGDRNKGAPIPEASEAEPVNIINGNMYIIKTDLTTFSPGIPFVFTRAYNSVEEADGPLGRGWTHNFNIRMFVPQDGYSPAIINDKDGRVIIFEQSDCGEFEPVAGEVSALIKNASGYLWEKKDKSCYAFDAEGILQWVSDKNENRISLSYDGSGRLTTIADTAGRTCKLTYDTCGHITSISDSTGRIVSYQYDANGNLVQVTDPVGVITNYEYADLNDPHNITKQIIGGTFTYTYGYDEQDRCIQASGPCGENGAGFEYHPEGRFTVITDSRGNTRIKYYNADGKVTRIVYPDASEEVFTWDERLNKISETRQDGSVWQYEYDGKGNLIKVIGPLGHQRTMTYDSNDNLTSLTDERGQKTAYAYDTSGNLIQVSDPYNTTSAFSYDSKGQILTFTDSRGNTTTYAYDTQGNLVSRTDPLGNKIIYQYDSLGRRISITDARGHTITYRYDALNRVTKITDGLGGIINTTHTQAGLASLTDANNNTTRFQYDVLNQLTVTTDPQGNTKTLTYDRNGNLASRIDYKGTSTTYDYDSLDRLTAIQYPDNSRVSFTYDSAGRMTGMTDSLGTSIYSYDSVGRLISYTNAYGQSVSYAYDETGNLLRITYPGNKVVSYTYDALNRLTQVTDWADRQTKYTYNQEGDLIQVTLPNDTKAQYTYDDSGRMTSLRNLNSSDLVIAIYNYTLDENGNIISEERNQPLEPTFQSMSVAYRYGVDNRLLHAGNNNISYDKNGNLITKGNNTYQYDYENRLTSITSSQGSWEYGYDGMGNRVIVRQNGDEHRFLIDPRGITKVLAEYDGSNTLKAYYIYGLGLLYKVDGMEHAYYYHFNNIGSTVAMTDDSEKLVNKYAYTPFGMIAGTEELVSNHFRYVGRFGVMDDGEDLVYMRARYYDPELGRFITKDPIGFAGGVNLYAYSLNNPVRYGDPQGLMKRELIRILKLARDDLLGLIPTVSAWRSLPSIYGEENLTLRKLKGIQALLGLILSPVPENLINEVAGVKEMFGEWERAIENYHVTGKSGKQFESEWPLGNFPPGSSLMIMNDGTILIETPSR
ncbi:MAG: hypothetical protein DRH20_01850 [Deltaproteobacteria bacterium]|nr:MAG: hypothetical protein DRH20_01850 [Deltaproteobacteria bacterium]